MLSKVERLPSDYIYKAVSRLCPSLGNYLGGVPEQSRELTTPFQGQLGNLLKYDMGFALNGKEERFY